jgi:ribonucleotide monophosphatase NagD (HAD superfamily)
MLGLCAALSTASVSLASSISGVRSIAGRYDAFLLDQFGVLHNGARALPGAVECFGQLAGGGKKLVVLSNTSRRKADAIKKIKALGFDASALTDFVCSGEEAWQHMAKKDFAGRRLLWLGWEDDYLGFDNAGFLN